MTTESKMTPKEVAEKACADWFAYQNVMELEMALRLVEEAKPRVIVEIGVANGASLAAWAEVCRPDIAIGIDPLTNPKTPEQQKSFDGLMKKYDIKIIPWISRLKNAHDQLETLLDGRKIDFLFIDAGHGFDDVRHDYYEYKKYMAPKSIVGFHDIAYNEVLFDAGSQVNCLWERLKLQHIDYDEFQFHSTMGIGLLRLREDGR